MAGGFDDLLAELFEPVGGVSLRRMFGGTGIFRHGIMFALVADGALYLKADDTTTAGFKGEGCGPFVYDGKDKPHVMSYWRVPERLYDEPDEFRDWALAAFRVAERARGEKPRRKQPARRNADT